MCHLLLDCMEVLLHKESGKIYILRPIASLSKILQIVQAENSRSMLTKKKSQRVIVRDSVYMYVQNMII